MTTGTVRLHRVLRAPPERVHRAFFNPDAMAYPGLFIKYEARRKLRQRRALTATGAP